ncbi:MAG: c-type cytochrome [Sphingobacteriales bacterium]|nr:c-type cytochrome [Sphingobacteriales bacterium]
MKKYLFLSAAALVIFAFSSGRVSAQDLAAGEGTFKQLCAACHRIGGGPLVGPDLANITQRRPHDWILKFVKSSQSVVKSGDKYADSLFQAFNKVVMPDQPTLTDEQVNNIISYIDNKSSASATTSPATTSEQTGQPAVNKGGRLFTRINILLLGVILFMLFVIFSLAKVNRNLLDQIRDFYSSDNAFFK